MKKNNLILAILLLNFLLGCQSVQEALIPSKKSGGDEFLVEKKSPLVTPPDYNELPKPKSEIDEEDSNSDNNDIKSLIINKESKINTDKKNSDTSSSIEDLILEKIND